MNDAPDEVTLRDAAWLKNVYRGAGERQLTARAVLTGMVLGGALSLSNVYVGLKIGFSFGVSLTASILAYAAWSGAGRLGAFRDKPTLLENNIAQTCAGAAGYMASSGLNSAIPALSMMAASGLVPDPHLSPVTLTVWICAISLLGVFTAVVLKRSVINADQLKFPSGAACAETLRSMYTTGADTVRQARALASAALLAAATKLLVDSQSGTRFLRDPARLKRILCSLRLGKMSDIPTRLAPPLSIGAYSWNDYSLGLPPSLLLIGAGALVGMKVAVSLAASAIINYGVLAPWLVSHGAVRVFEAPAGASPEVVGAAWRAFAATAQREHWIVAQSHERISAVMRTQWSLWPGTAVLVSANLVSIAFKWKTVPRALGGLLRGAKGALRRVDPLAHVEVPPRWYWSGLAGSALLCVAAQWAIFGIKWWMALVAVGTAVALGVVAARATGETDLVPIGPLGKITQLLFSVVAPGNVTANLMTANVTTGAAAHAGELLTDIKAGYLLGASPRKQLVAQLFGLAAGSLFCVPAYLLLSGQAVLGSAELPAPAAAAWRGMAEFLARGADSLPLYARQAALVGAVLGSAIALVDEVWPKLRPYTPSAMGIGIALVIDAQDSLAMLVGATLAFALSRKKGEWSSRYTTSVASGLIAGEGMMGVVLALLRALRVMT